MKEEMTLGESYVVGDGLASLLYSTVSHVDWVHVAKNLGLAALTVPIIARRWSVFDALFLWVVWAPIGNAIHAHVYSPNASVIGASSGTFALFAAAVLLIGRKHPIVAVGLVAVAIAHQLVVPSTQVAQTHATAVVAGAVYFCARERLDWPVGIRSRNPGVSKADRA